jgi:uncharacterized Fe-S center protein
MASKVFFANLRARGAHENKTSKIGRLFDAAGLGAVVGRNDLVAVKVHFGERGNDTFVPPYLVRPVIDKIKEKAGKPFVTDTNTLYAGSRHNAVDHLETAALHGFTREVLDAPVLIADGLLGDNEKLVSIDKKHVTVAKIAGAITRADAMILVSHFKGHELAGFGGAIKNLAMGCATGAGKREQHSPRFYVKEDACVGCGECVNVCPEQAASLRETLPASETKAAIDKAKCIGCGECYIHCPEKAIDLDWRTEVPIFMERMTEYAYAAVQGKQGKVGYINLLVNITPDCDCLPWSDAPIIPDIGVLAGLDPVALDQTCFDLCNQQIGLRDSKLSANFDAGSNKFTGLWGHTRPEIQLSYGEELGLGSRAYELVSI